MHCEVYYNILLRNSISFPFFVSDEFASRRDFNFELFLILANFDFVGAFGRIKPALLSLLFLFFFDNTSDSLTEADSNLIGSLIGSKSIFDSLNKVLQKWHLMDKNFLSDFLSLRLIE